MANIKVRHLIKRGSSYYWQPATALRRVGWRCRRLPDTLEAAIAEAEKINAEVDAWRAGQAEVNSVPTINSLSSLIKSYTNSNEYRKLGAKTKRDYDYRLSIIEKWGGQVPLEGITRKAVRNLWEKLAEKSAWKANATIRVLRLLLGFAVSMGDLQINPASKPGLAELAPRSVVWTPEEVAEFIATADRLGYYNVGTAIMLGAFIAQREADILKLRWEDYRGGLFFVKQNKTRAYISVPAHPLLADRLAGIKKDTGLIIMDDKVNKPYTQDAFTHRFDEVRKEVCKKIPEASRCKFMDLRRTAIVRLAEANCTEAQISAVSGHKIDTCRRILETYLPRNSQMAKAAITKLIEHQAA